MERLMPELENIIPRPLRPTYREFEDKFLADLHDWLLERYPGGRTNHTHYAAVMVGTLSSKLARQVEAELAERRRQEAQAQLEAYLAQHNLVTPGETAQRLGIPLAWLRQLWGRKVIWGCRAPGQGGGWEATYFPADFELGPEALGQVQVTRQEAARWLGIDPRRFDRLKRKLKVERVGIIEGRRAYLYRLADVERIREHIEGRKP